MVTQVESFEDGDITEFSGETGVASVVNDSGSPDGNYYLSVSPSFTPSTISDTSPSLSQGSQIKFSIYATNQAWFCFGVQSETGDSNLSCYRALINSNDAIELQRVDSGSSTSLNSASPSISSNTWYRGTIDWYQDGTIDYTIAGKTISATDTTYTNGGVGFGVYNNESRFDYVTKRSLLKKPTNVTASSSSDSITISWESASGASSYNILRALSSGSSASDYSKVGTVSDDGSSSFSFTDSSLKDGEKYYYRVESVS